MSDKYLIKNIVHVSCAVVIMEMVGKISHPTEEYWIIGGGMFLMAYALCIFTDILGLSTCSFVKHPLFRSTLSLLHGLDGFAALMIGVAIRYKSSLWLAIGLLMMTKLCLIHLLNRMILANKKTDNFFDGVTQTTKSFLHHVASFLFLEHPTEIMLTTVWRTISMSGHAALVLRDKLSHKSMHACHWALAYLRISFQIFVLYLCCTSPSIRSEFAASAVGHIAYMAVRLEPVFQQGSMYLTADEKQEWLALKSIEKIKYLLSGGHPWLALELVLLSILIVLFATLRVQLLVYGGSDVALSSTSAGAAGVAIPQLLTSELSPLAQSSSYLRYFLGSSV